MRHNTLALLLGIAMLCLATLVGCGDGDNGHGTRVPTIISFTPDTGSTAGGTSVTITGTHLTGASLVAFGTIPATSITVNSDTQITVTSPPHPAGTVKISVTARGGSITSTHDFTYQVAPPPPAAPTITSLSSRGGGELDGNTLTVTGTNFTGATAVTFGAIPARAFIVMSDTQIYVETPTLSLGPVYISITTPGGTAISETPYLIVEGPDINTVSPNSVSTDGGDTVTITGNNLIDTYNVTFDGISATSVTVVSNTEVTAVVPAHAAGVVQLLVKASAGDAAVMFTYTTP
ncbi:MAG TPA: IPT/TIG domain-containing protein [Armatimonadota bacterium]|jgi:hypothetical protein